MVSRAYCFSSQQALLCLVVVVVAIAVGRGKLVRSAVVANRTKADLAGRQTRRVEILTSCFSNR